MGNKKTMKLPDELQSELEKRIETGEFKSEIEIIEAALRYYFERHSPKDMAGYVEEEIQTAFEGSA
jgi:Arc/MetJ-type ribon-helix-helix transcriptional regulator